MKSLKKQLKKINENKILIEFARIIGIPPIHIIIKNQDSHICDIRHLYCKLRYDMHGQNYSKIGREINRTHTAVRYGISRINDLLFIEDEEIINIWEKVKNISGFYYESPA